MIFHLKSYPDALHQLFVSSNPEETNKAFEKALLSVQKTFSLPGYRKGKVPLDIIANSNPPQLTSLISNILIELALEDAKVSENGLYGQPRFNAMSGLSRDKEFLFSLVYENYPVITNQPDLSKEKFSYEACELDQDFMEKTMAKQIGVFEISTEAIGNSDLVKATILNEEYSGDKKEANFDTEKLELLISHKTNDIIEINFDDLSGYLPEFLGKLNNPLKIEITEVLKPKSWKNVQESDITDKTPFKSKEEYYKSTKEHFNKVVDQYNKSQKAKAVTKTLESKITVEIPKSLWLNNLRELAIKIAEKEIIHAKIALNTLSSNKEIQEKFSKLPIESVEGLAFIIWLDEYSQKEKITMDYQELEFIYYRHAQNKKISLEEFKKRISTEEKESIHAEAIREKAMTQIIDRAKFTVSSSISLSEAIKKSR